MGVLLQAELRRALHAMYMSDWHEGAKMTNL